MHIFCVCLFVAACVDHLVRCGPHMCGRHLTRLLAGGMPYPTDYYTESKGVQYSVWPSACLEVTCVTCVIWRLPGNAQRCLRYIYAILAVGGRCQTIKMSCQVELEDEGSGNNLKRSLVRSHNGRIAREGSLPCIILVSWLKEWNNTGWDGCQ